jgi:hypothetical protein
MKKPAQLAPEMTGSSPASRQLAPDCKVIACRRLPPSDHLLVRLLRDQEQVATNNANGIQSSATQHAQRTSSTRSTIGRSRDLQDQLRSGPGSMLLHKKVPNGQKHLQALSHSRRGTRQQLSSVDSKSIAGQKRKAAIHRPRL